jgi:hypothetical protein
MTVPVVEVVDVVAMGDGLVPAVFVMRVLMAVVSHVRQRMLVVVVVVDVVGMAIVDVVDVAFVLRAGVPTIGPVLMGVILVDVVQVSRGHCCSLLW